MPILNVPFPQLPPRLLPELLPRPLPPFPLPWFRECTPKILVVTDNLNYQQMNSIGLTEFVDTLRANTIGIMP